MKNKIKSKKEDKSGESKEKKDKENLKRCYTYNSLMKCLDKYKRENINKSLLINKFTSISNMDKYMYYSVNENEKKLLKSIREEYNCIKKSLQETHDWLNFSARIDDKLIIGLGNHSIFETDITLHHIYGIPYIPGSAIKGTLRNYIIQKYFKECINCDKNCNDDCKKNDKDYKIFTEIFGGKNTKGKVIFMDAFPVKSFKIKMDVMTPHHSNYYEKNVLPLDTDTPKPIKFLVLMKDSTDDDITFEFNLGIDKILANKKLSKEIESNIKNINKELCNYQIVKEFVKKNFKEALNFNGIGAKKSIGYGYFEMDREF
ncbi:type III-B CRISPR module RAMP protein Cmr6 [Crassaminicella indica]|uniref:Type III-B CRISPR module RAMP protein Cmr6 n=1 Tax=Crassaminicella indica TaxID=2855394 RepID=A0ABX8R8M6_9CLOT|nr:type III-B CRISPR module RAMP protein Cmr6 [Crassaminicella indica]QXM05373.1 type III-B CRISPR module RAMP protein Cmr6 [Crassaminicella indica]